MTSGVRPRELARAVAAEELGLWSHPLATLDARAPDDDLAFLEELVGDARVVGIGEFAHGIHECYAVRHRLLRFLVERLGFSIFAMESGFSEGQRIEAWIHGGEGDLRQAALFGTTYAMGACAEFETMLTWMRHHNDHRRHEVHFTGMDVPGSAVTYAPAIDALADYLNDVDPAAATLLAPARQVSEQLAGKFGAAAFSAYAGLDLAGRDAATAGLSSLAIRLDLGWIEYGSRSWPARLDLARQHLRLVRALDALMRDAAPAATGVPSDSGAIAVNHRDAAMADTVTWLLDRQPGSRVVVGAHNAHLQRLPMAQPGLGVPIPMLGAFLDARLGPAYVCIATTAGGGSTRSHLPDPGSPLGVRIGEAALQARPGSLEDMLAVRRDRQLVDLRPMRGEHTEALETRLNEGFVRLDVFRAYDAVIHLPTVRLVDSTVPVEEAFMYAGRRPS